MKIPTTLFLFSTLLTAACCADDDQSTIQWNNAYVVPGSGWNQAIGSLYIDSSVPDYDLHITSTNYYPSGLNTKLFVNSAELTWNGVDGWDIPSNPGTTTIKIMIIVPQNMNCGSGVYFNFDLTAGSEHTNYSSVSFIYPTGLIAGPKAVCAGQSATFSISREINTSGMFTWTVNTAGWVINGIGTSVQTNSLSITIQSPIGAPSQAILSVSGGNLCSTLVTGLGSSFPSTPGTVSVDQAGNSCYFDATIDAVPITQNYTWEWNYGANPTYSNSQTVLSTTMPDLVDESTSYWIRVKANNECGSSSWKLKSGTTQSAPNGCMKNLDIIPAVQTLLIYPNPTSDNISIETTNCGEIYQVELLASNGKKILENEIFKYDNQAKINLGHLEAGIYFLVVNCELKVFVDRIIIQ